MMLFLVSTPQIVSLEIAAKILIGEDHVEDLDRSKFKSKCGGSPGLLDLFLITSRKPISKYTCYLLGNSALVNAPLPWKPDLTVS